MIASLQEPLIVHVAACVFNTVSFLTRMANIVHCNSL